MGNKRSRNKGDDKGPAFSSGIVQSGSFQRYLGTFPNSQKAAVRPDRNQFGETNHERVRRQRQSAAVRKRAGNR